MAYYSLASNLRKAIRKSGYSARKLAATTGISQPTITRFLAGGDMMLTTAARLAKHLGV